MKKIAIIGASGMIGTNILKILLDHPQVASILSFTRKEGSIQFPKLKEIVLTDLADKASYLPHLNGIDAAFCCVGVYTGTVDDKTFAHVTTDIPVAFAQAVEQLSPGIPFCFLSGMGADPTEKSRMIFARTKGAAEKQIGGLNLDFHSFRPAYIYPVEKRAEPNFGYRISRTLYPVIRLFGEGSSIKSTELAEAMVKVGLQEINAEAILENKAIVQLLR